MPVKKLTVARGASVSHDDESWDRVFYSIEAEVNETELQVVKAELQGKLPYSLDEAILRYVVAGDVYDDGDSQQEVIAISAKRTVLEAYAKAAKRAGLEVAGINIESCAVVECFAHLFRRQADLSRTILFVDLGTKTTQVVS